MRILVTGSRDWDDEEAIFTAFYPYFSEIKDHILVSGGCPNGADMMAEHLWLQYGGTLERHPADWKQFGKSAGFRRNAEMVELGADICLAFIKNQSKGASMTAGLAFQNGIPVERYEK